MTSRDVRYCEAEPGVRIAYCVEGDGAPTIVALAAFVESFALDHLMPAYQRFYAALRAGRRLVRFDARGIGLSSAMPEHAFPSTYARSAADLLAIIEAVGVPAVVWAPTVAGPAAMRAAIERPDAISHLILYGTFASMDDGVPAEVNNAFTVLASANWETAMQTIADTNGRREFPAEAAQLGEWYARSSTAGRYVSNVSYVREHPEAIDMTQVRVPTLILHRMADPAIDFTAGQKIAAAIPDARFVPLEGKGHLFCLGDYGNILAAVNEFLGDRPASGTRPRVSDVAVRIGGEDHHGTAVILFADVVGSTAEAERLGNAAFRERTRRLEQALRVVFGVAGGVAIDGRTLGDGVIGVFTSAAQAIDAALHCGDEGRRVGLQLHLGIHAGDVIHENGNVSGMAVSIAARISDLTAPNEILVSNTVRELARASTDVAFEDRGEVELKGVGEAVRVYAVRGREGG